MLLSLMLIHTEYLIDEDAGSNELIKPLLRGRDLRKWKAVSANQYLIVIASSTNREWPWSNTRNTLEAEQIFFRNLSSDL